MRLSRLRILLSFIVAPAIMAGIVEITFRSLDSGPFIGFLNAYFLFAVIYLIAGGLTMIFSNIMLNQKWWLFCLVGFFVGLFPGWLIGSAMLINFFEEFSVGLFCGLVGSLLAFVFWVIAIWEPRRLYRQE